MDPIANLKRQLEISKNIADLSEGEINFDAAVDIQELAVELAELVQAAYAWRQMGGFDPFWRVTA